MIYDRKSLAACITMCLLLPACRSERPIPEILADFEKQMPGPEKLHELKAELKAHGTAAVDAWISLLKNGRNDYNLYLNAAHELGVLGTAAAPAIPALVDFLRDGYPGKKPIELSVDKWFTAQDIGRSPARKALAAIGVPTLDPVTALLRHESGRVRLEALLTLGMMGTVAQSRARDVILRLEDGDRAVATAATWTLGEIQHEDGIPALVRMLGDPQREIRVEAVKSLARYEARAQSVREHIRKLVGDPDLQVRRVAESALEQIPIPGTEGASGKGGESK